MITFYKEDLEFLNMYVSVADTKKDDISVYGRILFTANAEKEVVSFCQTSIESEMITEFSKKVDTSFKLILPTITVVNLIKQLPDESEITFKEDGIYFNGNRYAFEQHDIVFIEYNTYLKIAKDNNTEFTMIDLEKFAFNKNFIGQDVDGLDAVELVNGHFVSSNGGEAITSIIKTSNDVKNEYLSSKTLINLVTTNKKKQVEIAFYENEETEEFLSIVKFGDTYVFLKEKEYFIPPVFDEEFVDMYSHKSFIKVNKKDFLIVFNRIKLFTNEAFNYQFHVKCYQDSIELETKDENYACEKMEGEVSKDIVGKTFTLSAQHIGNVIKDLQGEFVYFYVPLDGDYKDAEDGEIKVCKISDENGENFYLNVLLEGN